NVYYYKKSYNQALNFYNKSNALFTVLKDSVNIVQCIQNEGVIYFNLHQFNLAESLLREANRRAKQLDLNYPVASIDLTLADLYIVQNKFNNAEKIINEGITFSGIAKTEKLQSDFKYIRYQLELKRKNYGLAVSYLYDIYKKDSIANRQSSSAQTTLVREQFYTAGTPKRK
ncbi:MAG TPA: hypothetical protein DCO83_01580, partial [Mucilaginibacter sp.]|nr:hypothetical protein [Mucilaginibacter sp.]